MHLTNEDFITSARFRPAFTIFNRRRDFKSHAISGLKIHRASRCDSRKKIANGMSQKIAHLSPSPDIR